VQESSGSVAPGALNRPTLKLVTRGTTTNNIASSGEAR
jgi:hypothetical protein